VRAPDVAFVRRERLSDPPPRGFAALAPDLVVEVQSPDDRPGELLSKVGDWLEAGTALVWVVDPENRTARVYRADGSQDALSEAERLDGETVLPGFTCALRQIFVGRALITTHASSVARQLDGVVRPGSSRRSAVRAVLPCSPEMMREAHCRREDHHDEQRRE
jgi:hypothetical protein